MIITPTRGWNPYSYFTQVPGCLLYLDARDPLNTGSQPSNGTAISTWYDKSGNGNNLIQATGGKQPSFAVNSFNKTPGVSFNYANEDGLYSTTAPILSAPQGSWTIYYVVNLLSTNETFFTDSEGANGRFLIYIASGDWSYNDVNGGHTLGAATTGKQIVSVVLDATGNAGTIYVNGTSVGNSTFTQNAFASRIALGIDYGNSFAPLDGTVGAYLIYNSAHSTTVRQGIEVQLGNIFGINAS